MNYQKNESQIMNLQMVEIDHNQFAVEVKDGNVSVNLTKMARSFGKKPETWLKTQEAQDYLNALSRSKSAEALFSATELLPEAGIPASADLLRVIKGGTPEQQGTWAFDYRIAMRFAQWLSPEFSIMVDDTLVKLMSGQNEPLQLTEKASPFSEETLVTVPMGRNVNQIYVTGGVIYARLQPILRYIGLRSDVTRDRIERIGSEHFMLLRSGKTDVYFVNFIGFNGLIDSMTFKMSSRTLCEIYRMFGVPGSDTDTGFAYNFTDDEMYEIMRAANRRPYNRADLLELLLNGRTEGGSNGTV